MRPGADYGYEGRDDSGRRVPTVDFVYPDDAPAPDPEPERSRRGQGCAVFIAVLKDGRRHTMPARLAALEYVFRMNGRTMREAAQEAGCELKTFFEAVRKITTAFER